MTTIEINNNCRRTYIKASFVRNFIKKMAKRMCKDSISCSYSFEDEKTVHELNLRFRQQDRATDILTFAECDCGFFPGNSSVFIGEVVICPPVLEENAKTFGVSYEDELARLLVHGFLHLCGMDHKTNDFETESMLVLQEKLLKEKFWIETEAQS